MTTGPSRRLEVACVVAREAGALARERFRSRPKRLALNLKGHQDYLSATDAEIEALIKSRLNDAFPDDAFYGEEGGGAFGAQAWVVDPVDGTANFVRGIPQFCISIGFASEGRAEVGVIYDPMADELFSAARAAGASLNGEPVAVSGLGEIAQSTIEAGWSTRLPLERYVAMLGRLATAGAGIRRGGSGALGLAYVAAGRIDAYCELHMNSWDALAGLALVQEAGGWTNDFLSNDGLTKGNPILACTPELRAELSALTGIG